MGIYQENFTVKLVLDGLNLINCIGFKENVQKLLTTNIETHQNQLAAEAVSSRPIYMFGIVIII